MSTAERRTLRCYRAGFPEDFVWSIEKSPALVAEDGLIYCADANLILRDIPENSVNLILTDPPYGIGYRSSVEYPACEGKHSVQGDTNSQALYLFNALVLEASRLLTPGGCLCCFAAGGGPSTVFADRIRFMRDILQFKAVLVWDRQRMGMGGHYRKRYEFILVAKKPGAPCTWNGGHSTTNILNYKQSTDALQWHPTPKPVELMEQLVAVHTNPRDLVLDPFCGAGASLIAAKHLGRRFLGIEIVPEYCEAATHRLALAQST